MSCQVARDVNAGRRGGATSEMVVGDLLRGAVRPYFSDRRRRASGRAEPASCGAASLTGAKGLFAHGLRWVAGGDGKLRLAGKERCKCLGWAGLLGAKEESGQPSGMRGKRQRSSWQCA